MPYITQGARTRIEMGDVPQTAGELNYAFTRLIVRYVDSKGLSYGTCADIEAAGQGALREFYRRVVGPMEDEKIKQNGDIYGYPC